MRAVVNGYWGFVERYGAPVRRRELPIADVVMVLSFGPELRLLGETHTSFVAGLTEASVVTEMDGTSHGMQVNLTPLGASMLLGVPMHTVANRAVALYDLLGRAAADLLDRLYDAPTWEARFQLLDRALARRLAAAAEPTPLAMRAWRRLVATAGRIPVRALADEVGCSRKHLAFQFREYVGLPPKAIARILRFQRARELVERNGGVGLAEIALECGYYDQAHLNRDFREFAASSPSAYLARLYPNGYGLAPE